MHTTSTDLSARISRKSLTDFGEWPFSPAAAAALSRFGWWTSQTATTWRLGSLMASFISELPRSPTPINAAAIRSFAPFTLPVKIEVVNAAPAPIRNSLRSADICLDSPLLSGAGPPACLRAEGALCALGRPEGLPHCLCKFGQRPDVGMRRIPDDFTTGCDNVVGPGLPVALRERLKDRLRRAATDVLGRIEIAGQDLAGFHLGPGLLERYGEVEIDHIAAQLSDAAQFLSSVPANMQAHPAAHRVNGVHQPLLEGPHELPVDSRTDERSCGIADSYDIGAGFDLHAREAGPRAQDELEQVAHELRVVEKIDHEAVDSTQVGRLGAGAFDPALDEPVGANSPPQQLDAVNAILHAAAAHRIRRLQPRQH